MNNCENSKSHKKTGGKYLKHQEKPKPSWKKTALRILLIAVIVICILAIGIMIYVGVMLGKINYTDGRFPWMSGDELSDYLNNNTDAYDPDFTGDIIHDDDIDWQTPVMGTDQDNDNVINVLLIGDDSEFSKERARSDVMLLCSYNRAQKKLSLVSFMRDTYVQIPGYRNHKLNSAYRWGGMDLLNETIEKNFGLKIDGNFAINFESFEAIIDSIGGIDLELTASEASHIDVGYQSGTYRLDGESALAHARNRTIGNGDFSRTSRQQQVVRAVIDRCMKMNVLELHNFMDTTLSLLSTNMSKDTIVQYTSEMVTILRDLKMGEMIHMPDKGAFRYAWVSDMSVIMPDIVKNSQILNDVLYGE